MKGQKACSSARAATPVVDATAADSEGEFPSDEESEVTVAASPGAPEKLMGDEASLPFIIMDQVRYVTEEKLPHPFICVRLLIAPVYSSSTHALAIENVECPHPLTDVCSALDCKGRH